MKHDMKDEVLIDAEQYRRHISTVDFARTTGAAA